MTPTPVTLVTPVTLAEHPEVADRPERDAAADGRPRSHQGEARERRDVVEDGQVRDCGAAGGL